MCNFRIQLFSDKGLTTVNMKYGAGGGGVSAETFMRDTHQIIKVLFKRHVRVFLSKIALIEHIELIKMQRKSNVLRFNDQFW